MLRRAKKLHSFFDAFCKQYHKEELALNREEWRQIEYLLWITHPFFQFTTLLSQTKDVTIHLVFSIYNKLFDHLEKSTRQLTRKKVAWKKVMLAALEAAKKKLSRYYSMTDEIHGDLYAIGTILSPQSKLQFFLGKDWDDTNEDWRARYRKSLEDRLEHYKHRLLDGQEPTRISPSNSAFSELEKICRQTESRPSRSSQQEDELKQYLESGKRSISSS
jgi:hypothetical protein